MYTFYKRFVNTASLCSAPLWSTSVKVGSALVCFLENGKGYKHAFFWVTCNLETTNRCG